MRFPVKSVALGLWICMLPAVCAADGVYKWQDARGVTHYSDKKPDTHQPDVSSVDLPATPSVTNPDGGRYQAIVKEADQLEASRHTREQARRKDRAPRLEQQRQRPGPAARRARNEAPSSGYIPVHSFPYHGYTGLPYPYGYGAGGRSHRPRHGPDNAYYHHGHREYHGRGHHGFTDRAHDRHGSHSHSAPAFDADLFKHH